MENNEIIEFDEQGNEITAEAKAKAAEFVGKAEEAADKTNEYAGKAEEAAKQAKEAVGIVEEDKEDTVSTMYNSNFSNVGDALGYALPTSALGFLTVFSVLALLWAILALFKVFFYTIPNKKKNAAKPVEAPKETAVEPAADTSEEETVAAIMGAISAYRAACGESAGNFRVVSFKKRA